MSLKHGKRRIMYFGMFTIHEPTDVSYDAYLCSQGIPHQLVKFVYTLSQTCHKKTTNFIFHYYLEKGDRSG